MFRIYTVLFPRREAFFYFYCHAVICYGVKSAKGFRGEGEGKGMDVGESESEIYFLYCAFLILFSAE